VSDPIKLIFLVSGTHKKRDPFAKAADERAMHLCQKFYDNRLKDGADVPAAVLRFVNFNRHENTIKVFDFPFSKEKAKPRPPVNMKKKWAKLADFTPTTGDSTFSPAKFVDASTPFTILNVYHSVRGAPPQSVIELSIFSHGHAEGPIILSGSTDDDDNPPNFPPEDPPKPSLRNEKDPNARARTDFQPNMGEDPTKGKPAGKFPRTGGKDALKEFKAAFDPQASFIIFGCNGQDALRDPTNNKYQGSIDSTAGQVLNQAYDKPFRELAKKQKKQPHDARKAALGKILAEGKIAPSTDILIDMDTELVAERTDIDNGTRHLKIFDPDKTKDKEQRRRAHYALDPKFFTTNDLKFEKDWSSVLGLVARRTQQTYAFVAATALAPIEVIAGPVGTRSTVDEGKQQVVCKGESESDCKRKIDFHEKFMRTNSPHPKWEQERRHFVYDADTLTHINKLATNS
jgi:hypothetical protein